MIAGRGVRAASPDEPRRAGGQHAEPGRAGADRNRYRRFLPKSDTGKQGYARKSYPGITAFLMFAADAVRNLLEVFAPLSGQIEEGTSAGAASEPPRWYSPASGRWEP